MVNLHQVDLLIAVREVICRNILSTVFGWYEMVYEISGAERHGDDMLFYPYAVLKSLIQHVVNGIKLFR